MNHLTRNNKFVAAVIALLVSVSAMGMLTTPRGALEHTSVVAVAILPEPAHLERERRAPVARSIRRRLMRWLRRAKAWRQRGTSFRSRLSVHQWLARGPP